MDWSSAFAPVADYLESHITLAVIAMVALCAPLLLSKGAISAAAYAAKRLQGIFGG